MMVVEEEIKPRLTCNLMVISSSVEPPPISCCTDGRMGTGGTGTVHRMRDSGRAKVPFIQRRMRSSSVIWHSSSYALMGVRSSCRGGGRRVKEGHHKGSNILPLLAVFVASILDTGELFHRICADIGRLVHRHSWRGTSHARSWSIHCLLFSQRRLHTRNMDI